MNIFVKISRYHVFISINRIFNTELVYINKVTQYCTIIIVYYVCVNNIYHRFRGWH